MSKVDRHPLVSIVKNSLAGHSTGMVSVCSSHPLIIEAAIQQSKLHNSFLLIETTSNQVDQFGGYSGMTPEMFQHYIKELVKKEDFDLNRVILGGDHLGPNRWKNFLESKAMSLAYDQISSYVQAGYRKIHLDASMALADDIQDGVHAVSEEKIAERTAQLCKVAEETYLSNYRNSVDAPYYVIGTEVPIPGGEIDGSFNRLSATKPEQAIQTVEITKKAFYKLQLEEAWERVIGLVVQPSVDFGNDWIHSPNKAPIVLLSQALRSLGHSIAFEAHSTDYQEEATLRLLVDNHFVFLKVGPALTFALRETLYALEHIERAIYHNVSNMNYSNLQESMERIMNQKPQYWKTYCDDSQLQYSLKHFGLSDRTRYYLFEPELLDSMSLLFTNLRKFDVPIGLVRQYLPKISEKFEKGEATFKNPKSIIREAIGQVLSVYYRATENNAEFQHKK